MKGKLRILSVAVLGIGLYLLFGANCLPNKQLVAEGQLFGRPVRTTVDHELARLMLTAPQSTAVQKLFEDYGSEPLNTATLACVAEQHSMDVATLYFLQRAYAVERNRLAQDRYYALLDGLGAGNDAPLATLKDHYVAFVPGLDHLDTTNGGDFARQRRLLNAAGVCNEMIATDPWGYTDANAAIVADRLRELSADHARIIVVSASKGGLETAVALGRLLKPEEAQAIEAWVSVGGILKGSPVADTYLHWPKCWVAEVGLWTVGQKIELVRDVSYARRSQEFQQLSFPQHIARVHYVGAPLSADAQERIASHYCSIRSFGPNDGITPLADEVTEGGLIISELGLDHYYKSPDIDKKTIALALMVAELRN